MKHVTKRLLLLVLIISGLRGLSQQAVEMTLKEAQDFAIKNAFSAKSATYDAQVAKMKIDALLGTGLPQINGSVQYNHYLNIPTQLVPAEFAGGPPGTYFPVRFGLPDNMTAGVSVNQLLFNGTWLVGVQASKAYAELQNNNVAKSEIDIKSSIAQAYHIAIISKRNAELLEESRGLMATALSETQALNEGGYVEIQDVEQLQLSLNDLDVRIANAKNQASVTLDILKFGMNMPLETELLLKDDAETLITDNSLDLINSPLNVEGNIDVKVVERTQALQVLNLKAEKSKLLPTLNAFYNLQSQAQRNEFNFFDTSLPWYPTQLYGATLSVPIFSGLSKSKNISIAKVEVQRATDLLDMTKRSKQLEYNSARAEYQYALDAYNSAKSSMGLSERILEKTRIKYKEGLSSSFEVTQLQTQFLTTQGQYVGAILNLLNAKIKLAKVLNQL